MLSTTTTSILFRTTTKSKSSTIKITNQFFFTKNNKYLHSLKIGIPKETTPHEHRVAITPTTATQLIKRGAIVSVTKDAGLYAGFNDTLYTQAGCQILSNNVDTFTKNDVIVKITPPTMEQVELLQNRTIISLLKPSENVQIVDALMKNKATAIALDLLLRTLSRGQAFDVLSSQANIAGYRAVIEAAGVLQRPFAGQSTAAGKIEPTRVMVVGAGVAGLAAIQTAKALGGIVSAFDVRSAAKEQVEAVGAKFLAVPFTESGDGSGGYAKEMSPEWFEAARKMLLKECEKTNVIITTALIPGKRAPILITRPMVENMPQGGVTVDVAAEAGGNVETTKPNEVITMPNNGVKCMGYTNLPSRMANISSQLFAGNVTKLLLSMEDTKTKQFIVNREDDAVRSMLHIHKGEKLEPYRPPVSATPPPPPPAPSTKPTKTTPTVLTQQQVLSQALMSTGLTTAAVGLGSKVPDTSNLATLMLSIWVGSQAVRGVTHALHSPLMSITNAVSGMTIVGGMLQLGGGVLPHTVPQMLATTAVGLSAVNLSGGFLITRKMLAMFRRKDDPPEYWSYFLLPPAVAVGGYSLLTLTGNGSINLSQTLALASGLGCVAGIAQMSRQETARLAVIAGMGGVGMGVVATLGQMNPSSMGVYAQLVGASTLGGALGYQIANKVGPTELPQAVAGFHSLVGVAAASTAVGDFMIHSQHMDGFHATSIYLGAWMGGITATGSVIAFGKLAEKLDSKPLMLPGRDALNIGMAGGSVLGLAGFLTTKDPYVAGACLASGTTLSGLLGLHMTASIGGADMPVVITLLNSYSGWALCAEGAILNQPLLTIVGALIGSSGAFLTKVMCDSMNRSLVNVILGGYGMEAGSTQSMEGLVHREMNTDAVAQALLDAQTIMFVPGYGLAVAQAQGVLAEIATALTEKGKDVKFAVHPVGGRLPGQISVILAEAGVPYDKVYDMDEANQFLTKTDVCVVVGANDTVNTAADDPKSSIAGMPIIRVLNAKNIIFIKRSMASGYSGSSNPAFYDSKSAMFLGDAGKVLKGLREKLGN
jgi:NAD(P) transhydrogenase